MLFDPHRYDLAKVGVYKINKKLSLANRIQGHQAAENLVSPDGEILLQKGEMISKEVAWKVQNFGINEVRVFPVERKGSLISVADKDFPVMGNSRVDAKEYLKNYFDEELVDSIDFEGCGITEMVRTSVLSDIIAEVQDADDVKEALEETMKERATELWPMHLTVDDIIASISYLIGLPHNVGRIDDIDHLGNRRVRSVGELLQNQMRIGFSRMGVWRVSVWVLSLILKKPPRNSSSMQGRLVQS